MCAGPFSQELLGIDNHFENGVTVSPSTAIENALLDKQEVSNSIHYKI